MGINTGPSIVAAQQVGAWYLDTSACSVGDRPVSLGGPGFRRCRLDTALAINLGQLSLASLRGR